MRIYTHTKQILADTKTPIGLYLALRDQYRQPLLLESSDYNSKNGHYSYICLHPLASIALKDDELRTKINSEIKSKTIHDHCELMSELNTFKDQFEYEELKLSFCYTGLFGYTSYDIVKYTEEINLRNERQFDIPQLLYNVYGIILIFDHQTNSLNIISHEFSNERSKEQLQSVLLRIKAGRIAHFPFEVVGDEHSLFSDDDFLNSAKKAKQNCQLGDVFQLVISKRFEQQFKGDDFNVYRALKNINPSPYLFYFDLGDFHLFGSSPEAQLVIQGKEAEIHPIAGTYRKTGNDKLDLQKANELAQDPKENSEHIMLVDLARNDLSKYCSHVEVKFLKQIQFYSHVIHLVSKIKGVLKKTDPFEVLFGTFPAGTLSGAPKHRAMQLIEEYEPVAREYYGGCVGFISHNNDLNHAIMIRTFLSKDKTLYYQAGAGIVISSNEQSELQEVKNKVSALKKAMQQAQNFNNIVEASPETIANANLVLEEN
jgi:anthranilate synthase component 1